MKTYNHPTLKIPFQYTKIGVIFKDNVFYSNNEIEILKKNKPDNLKTIHLAKKMFDGELIGIPVE